MRRARCRSESSPTVLDGLMRAMVEQPARFDRADLRHRDEQVEHLGAGEVVGTGGEDLLEADRALTQILFEFRPQPSNLVRLLESAFIRRSGERVEATDEERPSGLCASQSASSVRGSEVALVEGGSRSGCPRGIAPPVEVGRDHDHDRPRLVPADDAGRLDSVHARHLEIEQDEIRS